MNSKKMKHGYSLVFFLVTLFLLGCGEDDGNSGDIIFSNEAPTEIAHNEFYFFKPKATHTNGDPVTIIISAPNWMTYHKSNNYVTGTPGITRIDQSFKIDVTATNGIDTAFQRNDVKVNTGEVICESDFGNPEDSPYVLPFEVGETFEVNQTYCPPHSNWGHFNTFALDFETPMGTNIIAMRAGKVIKTVSDRPDHIFDCENGGNSVYIEHDDGTVARYVHLKQFGLVVSENDQVAQNQLIGVSGDSGCSSGPHTHVEVFIDKYHFARQFSLPFNFNNADGPLNSKRGLVQNGNYTAL